MEVCDEHLHPPNRCNVKKEGFQRVQRDRYEARGFDMTKIELETYRVSKSYPIDDKSIKKLKLKGLIEGRKPNLHISSSVAITIDQKSEYMKIMGIDDSFVQKMILDYLQRFGEAKRADFEKIVLDKLPEFLGIKQKRDKVKNNLQTLKKANKISNDGDLWKMSNE